MIRVADANMINALKLVSIQRGYDPRDFVLIAAGGGGPMHAAPLGRELGVKAIVIPRYPGYFSAWGMLATEPRGDFIQTKLSRDVDTSIEQVRDVFKALETEAKTYFQSDESVDSADLEYERSIDLRYLGQEHSVTVEVDPQRVSVDAILIDFHAAHERAYTFRLDDTPVEFVTFRLAATAHVPLPELNPIGTDGRSAEAALKGRRTIDLGEDGKHEAAIYERDLLPPGFAGDGPLIVEEPSSNTLVHPGQRLAVDELGFLHITEK